MNKVIKNEKDLLKKEENFNIRRFNNLSEDALNHSGILGMRWGVRRDNPSGSSSSSSSSSAPKSPTSASSSSDSSSDSSDSKIAGYNRKELMKNVKSMSTKDLNDVVNRLQTEKRLKELAQSEVSYGKAASREFLKTLGNSLITRAATSIGEELGKQVGSKMAGSLIKGVTAVTAKKVVGG